MFQSKNCGHGFDLYVKAIFQTEHADALRDFHANREPTDRLIGETPMTKREYKDWKDGL